MCRRFLRACAGIAALLVVLMSAGADALDVAQVVIDFGMPADAVTRIRSGEMLEADPTESSERELAVGLTFLVGQPIAVVLDSFRAAVDMRADRQLRAAFVIHGTTEDFAALDMPPDEAKRYLAAAPGDALNLSPAEIAALHALASAGGDPKANAERQLKSLLLDRYRAYLANGISGIAPYARNGGLRKPADELQAAAAASSTLLSKYSPELASLLVTYPRAKPAKLEERFYLLRYDLDGRPNYTLRHRMVLPFNGGVSLIDRDFYVSRGYNTAQSTAGLIPVPEGTLVFYRSRVSTDQVSGLGGSVKRKIGRSVMAKQLTEIFQRSRASFEPTEMSSALVGKNPGILR
jgi:hypothetical protein